MRLRVSAYFLSTSATLSHLFTQVPLYAKLTKPTITDAHFTEIFPPLRVIASNFVPHHPLLSSHTYHLLSNLSLLTSQISLLHSLRSSTNISTPPIIIYEPEGRELDPSALPSVLLAMKQVDIIFPNHLELGHLFGHDFSSQPGKLDKGKLEELAKRLQNQMAGKSRLVNGS